MWQVTYKEIDKSGLQPELNVTVEYSNDIDTTTYIRKYTVMPEDFNSDGFKQVLQNQIDILNAKDGITSESIAMVVDKPIDIMKPIGAVDVIK
jgi:hypothetical protein